MVKRTTAKQNPQPLQRNFIKQNPQPLQRNFAASGLTHAIDFPTSYITSQ
jgi:hypothetical protein